jgi:hypothetical protein
MEPPYIWKLKIALSFSSCVKVIGAWAAISFEEKCGRDLIPSKFLEDRLVGIVRLFGDILGGKWVILFHLSNLSTLETLKYYLTKFGRR